MLGNLLAAAESRYGFSEETHWEKAAETRMGKYLTRIETQFIKDSIRLQNSNILMDIGAEAGRFSNISVEGTLVISIDIESYGLQRLKLKTRSANVIQADARNLPLKDAALNLILMIEVLDYIPELNDVFAECYRTLQPWASLVVSFGNKSSIKAKLRATQGKSYQHSYQSVTNSLSRAGFKLKKRMGYNWLPFGRTSESALIPIFVMFEKVLALRRIPRYSPWVMIHAEKPLHESACSLEGNQISGKP